MVETLRQSAESGKDSLKEVQKETGKSLKEMREQMENETFVLYEGHARQAMSEENIDLVVNGKNVSLLRYDEAIQGSNKEERMAMWFDKKSVEVTLNEKGNMIQFKITSNSNEEIVAFYDRDKNELIR